MLDREAKLLYATPSGAAALERFFDRAYDGRLPGAVEAWLSQGCPGRLTVTRDGVRLSIDPVGARPAALLLRETPSRPTPALLRTLGLTTREADVLALLVEGAGNEEIARLLTISPRTVKKHLESVYAKLGVHTRAAAVSVALQRV